MKAFATDHDVAELMAGTVRIAAQSARLVVLPDSVTTPQEAVEHIAAFLEDTANNFLERHP